MLFAQRREQVMGKWTKGLDRVVMIVLDEVKLRSEADSDFLKSIITEDSIHVTGKYMDDFEGDNKFNIIMCTNHRLPIPEYDGVGDARFVFLELNSMSERWNIQ